MTNELDLDLVFLDFSQAYQEDSQRALHMAHALLLDEVVCCQRIDFLKQLGTWAKDSPKRQEVETNKADRFTEEVRLLGECGVMTAIQQLRLTPDQLSTILSHPVALWEAHLAMIAIDTTDSPQSLTTTQHRIPMRLERQPTLAAATSMDRESKMVFLGSKEGYKLEAWSCTRKMGHTELRLVGDMPQGEITLLVDNEPLELIQPFDACGTARVRTSDIQNVLIGKALLELIVKGT